MSYAAVVTQDQPSLWWRLGDTAGSVSVADAVGTAHSGTPSGAVTLGVPGLLRADANTAASFEGTDGVIVQNAAGLLPSAASIEVWLQTSTQQGGVLAQFASGDLSASDLTLYLRSDGTPALRAGSSEIARERPVNDGRVYHVVGTLDAAGDLWLYVNGSQAAHASSAAVGSPFSGHWRLGNGATGALAVPPASSAYAGVLDEFAVYTDEDDAMKLLDTQTVGSGGAASIDFSSISGAYTHLLLIVRGRSSASDSRPPVLVGINDATGDLHNWCTETIEPPSDNLDTDTTSDHGLVGFVPGSTAPAGRCGDLEVWFPFYASTAFDKTWSARSAFWEGDSGGQVCTAHPSGIWTSTAAITSLHLILNPGNWVAGSVATLYGIL